MAAVFGRVQELLTEAMGDPLAGGPPDKVCGQGADPDLKTKRILGD
jgi:hypothetical protein